MCIAWTGLPKCVLLDDRSRLSEAVLLSEDDGLNDIEAFTRPVGEITVFFLALESVEQFPCRINSTQSTSTGRTLSN